MCFLPTNSRSTSNFAVFRVAKPRRMTLPSVSRSLRSSGLEPPLITRRSGRTSGWKSISRRVCLSSFGLLLTTRRRLFEEAEKGNPKAQCWSCPSCYHWVPWATCQWCWILCLGSTNVWQWILSFTLQSLLRERFRRVLWNVCNEATVCHAWLERVDAKKGTWISWPGHPRMANFIVRSPAWCSWFLIDVIFFLHIDSTSDSELFINVWP